jgi:4-amino-4-deoxy-L-arabinose transferase-like glycosyltransferase
MAHGRQAARKYSQDMLDRRLLLVACAIFIIALFFRSYRIAELTEFLGDQGSAASVILDAVRSGTVPLHGPAVSSGQYPGPFYYYIIAPSLILSGFRPLFGALTVAFLGSASSVVLALSLSLLFGPLIGYSIGVLYAVSPLLVNTERNMWNPSPTPFLFVIALYALVRLEKKGSLLWGGLLFAAAGILVQLHYTNLFTLGFFVTYYVFLILARRREFSLHDTVKGIGVSMLAFIAVLLPFIVFEFLRGFSDITDVISVFGTTREPFIRKSEQLYRMYMSTAGQWQFVTTGINPVIAALLLAATVVAVIMSKSLLLGLMLVTFLVARFMESGYTGKLYLHYQLYTGVFAFVFLGSIFGFLKKYAGPWPVVTATVLILGNSLLNSDINSTGRRDLLRAEKGVQTMIMDAGAEPFAFTVTHSRSYSDFHYRFFLQRSGVRPVDAASPEANLLYIACDSAHCPDDSWMSEIQRIYILCHDHHCQFEYPQISLLQYRYIGSLGTGESVVYKFVR